MLFQLLSARRETTILNYTINEKERKHKDRTGKTTQVLILRRGGHRHLSCNFCGPDWWGRGEKLAGSREGKGAEWEKNKEREESCVLQGTFPKDYSKCATVTTTTNNEQSDVNDIDSTWLVITCISQQWRCYVLWQNSTVGNGTYTWSPGV